MKPFLPNCLRKCVAIALLLSPLAMMGQQSKIQNWRPYDQSGINVFESPKDSATSFDGLKVRIGAGFTQQFQSLKHSNTAGSPALYPRLKSGFNLAMANLNIDVQLADGIALNLVTYLSARHHNEAWVKGGYIQFDKVPFKGKVWDDIFKVVTLKVGHMQINYGDQHFRRSDGGQTLYNPFIENYIMDAFATEIGAEVILRKNDFTGVLSATNGLINGGTQAPLEPGSTTETYKRNPSLIGKLAYDKQFTEKVRVRVAGSAYYNSSAGRSTLYAGDRTGSNYFFVMESAAATAKDNFTSGRVSPNFTNQVTALQFNGLLKVSGLELFGTYENAQGRTINEKVAGTPKRKVNQYAVDAIYRIGVKENLFLGVRYNQVKGELVNATTEQTVDRVAFGAGWFLTKNILMKGEYVNQKYKGYATGNILNGGNFKGVVIQAVVGF
jgi:predicted porin